MAARNTASKGAKPDKFMRDALILELHREVKDGNGRKVKKLRLVARSLVDIAMTGDIPAIREINDRIDGKPMAKTELSGTINLLEQLVGASYEKKEEAKS